MKTIHRTAMRHGRGNTRRGTVLVLVVAVLALLAVMGTVFIVSARTERATAGQMNATYNLKLAQDAAMQQVVEVIGGAMVDANGRIGGWGTGAGASQNHDFPDGNEAWLAGHMHPQATELTNKYTQLTPAAFNPSLGTYSLGFTLLPNSPVSPFNTVVADETTTATDTTTDDPPNSLSDAYMNLLPFSDASGIRYRVSQRILDLSRMANLNVGSTDDNASLADTNGVWLTDVRLAPTSGWPTPNAYFNTADNVGPLSASFLQASTPSTSGLGRAGLSTQTPTFSPKSWQDQIFRFEKNTVDPSVALYDLSDELELRTKGEFGSPYHLRPGTQSASLPNYTIWPNTLSNNVGSPDSGIVLGNRSRRNYTTVSISRDIRPYSDPDVSVQHSLTIVGGSLPSGTPSTIWPPMPAKISMNPQTASPLGSASVTQQQDAMYYTAMAATNFATLMEYSCANKNFDVNGTTNANFADGSVSYSHEEACAFAANYCTAKWNGFIPDDLNLAGKNAYYLPAGPSFVDSTGICIRTATTNAAASTLHREFGNGSTDLHAESPHKVYLGYSAQPYFSEIAATLINDDTAGAPGTAVPTDTAVELYNPYNVALSLTGYHIKSSDQTTVDIPLNGQYVPAHGYFVLTSSTHFNVTASATVTTVVAAGLKLVPAGDKFLLYRPYLDRTMAVAYAPVDQMSYTDLTNVLGVPALPSLKNGDQPKDFSIARAGGPVTGAWAPTINPASFTRTLTPTLGADNAIAGVGFPLPDRYAPTVGTAPTQGDPFGMGEFARIIRIANEFDNSTMLPVVPGTGNGGLISDHITQLAANITTAPYSTMTPGLQVDAQILFDFYGDPRIYLTAPPTDTGIPTGQRHDIRAVRLQEQFTMIDRVSEFGIDVGGGANDVAKIRIPGQINVNTASGDVLRAIPNMTDTLVAKILAYRNRNLSGTTSTATYNGASATFSSTNTAYPGTGIHSLAELLVAVTDPASTATIETRDLPWGPLCAACTVRSDTFVVYGYIEALKVNPNYTAGHNNGVDWYGAVTDNPRDTNIATIPNLRVARRRWVAIVDRSFCNANRYQADGTTLNPKFSLPRVVAIKDLPK